MTSDKQEIIAYLLSQPNIDVNVTNNKGQTPLDIACYLSSVSTITMLLNAGASLSSPVLVHHCIKGQKTIVEMHAVFKILNKLNYPFDNVDSKGK